VPGNHDKLSIVAARGPCDHACSAQWVRTLSAERGVSEFTGLATDGQGNVNAAGDQEGRGTYGYGDGVNATGTSASLNVRVVKYGSSGRVHGARTVSGGSLPTYYQSVAFESCNRVYAAGYQNSTEAHCYRTGVSATEPSMFANAMLVMYR
ncbi:MAG: hypothetical protein QHH01_06440, partial [Spirochaetales bacterium]|nr:hypothetical protein [Spirochaetales bacterium]